MKKGFYLISVLTIVVAIIAISGCAPKPQSPPPEDTASVIPNAGIKTGDSVAAPWGGSMYLGTVKSVEGEMADVLYADDKQVREVKTNSLKILKPEKWTVGSKVLAVWTTGKFYPGTITENKGNEIYTVKWDDGSEPSDVVAAKIMTP